MARKSETSLNWLFIGGAAVIAGAAGFGLASLGGGSGPQTAPAAQEAPANTKAKTELTVPEGHIKQAGIGVEQMSAGNLSAEINAAGTVVSSTGGEAVLVARAAGTISKLEVRLGDPVKAGQTIALVDSLDASTIASDRAVAAAKAAQARAVLAREKKLADQGVTARQDYEAAKVSAEVAEAELQRASSVAQAARVSGNGRSIAIVSPISGRVTAQNAVLGAYVTPDAELFRVANNEGLQIEASIPAADASKAKPGDAVIVSAGGETFNGTVRSVTPTANSATGAATVLVSFTNPGTIVAGTGVQVKILSQSADLTGIVIPDEAIQVIDGQDAVFLRTPKGFKVQPVTVARRTGGRAEITTGLEAGQSIATRNAFLLKAELNKATED